MEFIDSLADPKHRSPQTKDIIKEFEIFQQETDREDYVRRARGLATELEEYGGVRWVGRAEYYASISLIPSDPESAKRRVKGALGGTVIGAKHGNVIVLFHLFSEWEFHEQLQKDAMEMISTLSFDDKAGDDG
jgi:hypothetical protein